MPAGGSLGMIGATRGCNDPPGADDHLGFFLAVEDLQLHAFIAEFPIEALTVPILPRATGKPPYFLRQRK